MANRLKDQASPYLLQHAENPVEWHPWGAEALALAVEQDKPIFLSIGYAACHWCHVMAHESFEDPQTAAIMNEHFINIKVDREERPDLDSLYMDAVVAMTGQGGWPMSVFLTPEAKPFYGGTYFPPTRRLNLPSFRELLQALADKWRDDREGVRRVGEELVQRVGEIASLLPGESKLDASLIDRAAETLFRSFDWTHAGWGRAPKFPQPMSIEFLLRRYARSGEKLALEMATNTLRAMARGGIFDQLAGGFARYSVDEHWLVPHFEKMLYDNAQLVRSYLHAWQVTGDPGLLATAEATLGFMLSELRGPEGGFYSSLDADSDGEEGKYYVWSLDEIRGVIADKQAAELFVAAYGVTEAGNFEGTNILHRAADDQILSERFSLPLEQVASELAQARQALMSVREGRVRPGLDDKVLTAWNGLALVALAEMARGTGRARYLEAAHLQATFLLNNLMKDGRLLRSWRAGRAGPGAYLDDHAALGLGLLALYQADFDPRWYRAAVDQAEEILAAFADPQGGFFDTRHDHEALIARPKSIQDSPTPSGNTLACQLLLTLGAFEGESRYLDPADSVLRAIAPTAAQHPTAFAGWLCALDFALGPQLQLAMTGSPDDPAFRSMAAVANGRYLPNLVLAGGQPGTPGMPRLMDDRSMRDSRPTAYLCQGFACRLPTTSPTELVRQFDEL
ncbi:MAG: thioredoxin domain-containing protein [Chloroflexota bacterium]